MAALPLKIVKSAKMSFDLNLGLLHAKSARDSFFVHVKNLTETEPILKRISMQTFFIACLVLCCVLEVRPRQVALETGHGVDSFQ